MSIIFDNLKAVGRAQMSGQLQPSIGQAMYDAIPKCERCGFAMDDKTQRFCDALCSEEHHLDIQENVIAKGN